MGYCARHMSRNRGLVFRSQAFHISINSSFWAFIRKEVMFKSRTIFLGRYGVATVEFIVGRFGV